LTATPSEIPCSTQSQEFIKKLEALFDEWDDANTIASNTARISLGTAVKDLQAIRRQVSDLEVPGCALSVKQLCVNYMDTIIEAYLAFMREDPNAKVQAIMDQGQEALIVFTMALVELKTGVKLPTRTPTYTPAPTNTPEPTSTPALGMAEEKAAYIGQQVRLRDNDDRNEFTLTVNRVIRGDEAAEYSMAAGGYKKTFLPDTEYCVAEWTLSYTKGITEGAEFTSYLWDAFTIYYGKVNFLIGGIEEEFNPDPFRKATSKDHQSSITLKPGDTVSFWTIHTVDIKEQDLIMVFEESCKPCGWETLVAYFRLQKQP